MPRIMSILLSFVVAVVPLSAGKLKFVINYPTEQDGNILEGRVLLMLAKSDEAEPRFPTKTIRD